MEINELTEALEAGKLNADEAAEAVEGLTSEEALDAAREAEAEGRSRKTVFRAINKAREATGLDPVPLPGEQPERVVFLRSCQVPGHGLIRKGIVREGDDLTDEIREIAEGNNNIAEIVEA